MISEGIRYEGTLLLGLEGMEDAILFDWKCAETLAQSGHSVANFFSPGGDLYVTSIGGYFKGCISSIGKISQHRQQSRQTGSVLLRMMETKLLKNR